jgi:ATP-binding cassette, subfamily B, bacterial PglK
MKTLKIFFGILSKKSKIKSFYLLLLVLVGVIFEMLSIGLLLPLLTALSNETQNQYINFNLIYNKFGIENIFNKNQIIMYSMSLLVLIYFTKTIFLNFLVWFQSKFISFLVAETKIKLFKKYMYQDYSFHLQRNSSKLIQNIINEVELMINVFFLSLVAFTSELLVVLGISLILLIVEPRGFLMSMTVFGIISVAFMKYTKNKVKKYGDQRLINESSSIKHLQQGVDGIKEIKLVGNEDIFLDYFKVRANKIASVASKMLILQQIPRFYLEFIAIISLTALIYFLLIFNYTFSSLIVIVGLFAAAAFKILPSVNRILNSYVNMRYGLASVGVISKDINMPSPKIEAKLVKGKKLKLNSKIELKNISYNYPSTNKKILENLNLEIKANSTIGIIGESGAGKSTLIDLIIGILNPSEGKVLIDGNNISEQKRLWQNNIGYIPQFIYLLDDSIKKNIALGAEDSEIDDKKIIRAMELSQTEKFVKNLPKKNETFVGEFGVRLSGGQRQRIGIARALYFDNDLLVLDEATSSLDDATEKDIINTIHSMKGKKTIIISSHKKEILKECDAIFKLKDKKIFTYPERIS